MRYLDVWLASYLTMFNWMLILGHKCHCKSCRACSETPNEIYLTTVSFPRSFFHEIWRKFSTVFPIGTTPSCFKCGRWGYLIRFLGRPITCNFGPRRCGCLDAGAFFFTKEHATFVAWKHDRGRRKPDKQAHSNVFSPCFSGFLQSPERRPT